ncbi:MAG TPA: iron oxidase [Burkholderiales bacterium]
MDDRRRSRRSILKFAGLLAGASLAPGVTRDALAQQKASKQAMKYQDKPNGDQKCGNCLQFEAPKSCKVVQGDVSPNGYCIAWAKKP